MLSDEELMERLKEGKDSALDQLVRRYEAPLFAFACRMLQEGSAAEDAFQETFLKVYRRRQSFQQGARFRPWLYKICLNLCRDQHRRRQQRREVELCEQTVGADHRPGPQEWAERSAQAQRVREALAKLPQKQAEVLILTQYQELSQQEVSELLGIPEGTVKSRKFQAIRQLAKLLSGSEEKF